MKPSRTLLSLAALLFAACGPNARGDDDGDDGDDGDDSSDPPDASNCTPVAATDLVCNNGADDDCDGFTDCEDIDCLNHVEEGCPSTDCGEASHTEPAPLVLPDDGTGTMFYENTLNITGFPANLTLTDITKLTRLCVNMEHSWLRDLEISAFAPNGTQVILSMQLGNTGSQIFMGVPNDNDEFGTPIPGTGWEYCWAPNAGRIDMLPYCNANPCTTIPASTNHPTDDYAASSSFSPWQGTVLNGDWRMRVRDLWAIDNGHIFSWSITFDQSLVSDCEGFPTE